MSEPAQIVTFDQMKGAIGSLVWLWSEIERALAGALRQLDAAAAPVRGISRSLDAWSEHMLREGENRGRQTLLSRRLVDCLKEALAIRNLVCHGLVGIKAQHPHACCEAHLTVELGDDRRILTWSALEEMFAWMSRAPWMIRDLTAAAMERDAERGNMMLAGWEDFPRQR